MSKVTFILFSLIAVMILLAGCGGDSGGSAVPTNPPSNNYAITTVLNNLVELGTIGNTGNYEMWAKVGGSDKSIGKFQVTGNIIRNLDGAEIGKLNEPFTLKSTDNLRTATEIYITVDEFTIAPATRAILKGYVDNATGQVTLNPGYAIIEGGNTQLLVSSAVGNISGSYRIVNNNEISFKSSSGQALLTLEQLNTSWTYGAWVVNNGSNTAELIGRFSSASEAPGKTFSYNINDGNHSVIITAEPSGIQNTQPFTLLKILYATIPSGGNDIQNMTYNSKGLPRGSGIVN